MSYNILKLKKSKYISRLKKFSNIEVFGRREKELLEKINSNKIITTKLNQKNKKIDLNDNLSKYALKTISSFDFITTGTDSITQKKNKEKNELFLSKNKSNKTIFPFYQTLTEFNTNKKMEKFKNNKFFSTNDIRKHNNKVLNKYNNYSDRRFNTINNMISSNRVLCIKEKESKIELLKELGKENIKHEKKINKKFISILRAKQKKFNVKKEGLQNMLVQTRNLMLYKYTQNIKKEINKRMQENYENKLESIKDKINTIKMGTNLYDIKLANKLTEYIKYMISYRDEEKKKCDLLENNKNKYKKEIMLLQNKIKKAQLEKDNILRWVYFQIKMKEKKLILPQYYQIIIETDIKRNIMRRKTISSQLKDMKIIRDSQNLYHNHNHHILSDIKEEHSNKNLDSSQSIKKIKFDENHSNNYNKSKYKIHRNSTLTKTKNNNSEYSNGNSLNFEEINTSNKTLQKLHQNLEKAGVDGYEINRITQYKLFLIYATPEEFEERLTEFENENIILIEQYNSLQRQLNELKIQYNKIKSEKKENEIYNINQIKLKEYELKEITKINELLKNQISDMKKGKFYIHKYASNTFLKNNYKFNHKKNLSSTSNLSLGKEIYSRISKLYNLFKADDHDKNEKGKKMYFGEQIISMLTYIESKIDKLKDKFRIYNRTDYENYETMRKLKNDIEKRHKIEKGEMLRLKEKEKFYKFQEEIENKMKKIIFIQRRKNDTNYNINNFEKNRDYYANRKYLKEPNFEDFIYDKNDFINFDYKI